jgi:hypothetical protein
MPPSKWYKQWFNQPTRWTVFALACSILGAFVIFQLPLTRNSKDQLNQDGNFAALTADSNAATLKTLTTQLRTANKEHAAAAPAQKPTIEARMKATAEQRKQAILQALQRDDVDAVLAVVIPSA